MPKKLLVTGGAGYIGSHTIRKLKQSGHDVVVFDDLSSGHRDAIEGFELVVGSLADKNALKNVFDTYNFDSVIHFAGSIEAGESMTDPKRFFNNNLVCGLNLLDAMLEHDVKKIVFSSTAAVYGEPEEMPARIATPARNASHNEAGGQSVAGGPIMETAFKNPTNIYGLTKLMFEQVLDAYDHAYGLRSVALRYFNAAGADPSGEIGPDHASKTALIEIVMLAALGKRESVKIFGTDYPTRDGTGVRDYIHVNDLADAHVLALEYLAKNNSSEKFNLGNERGISVREVIETAKKITEVDFPVIEEARRDGDSAEVFASSRKAQQVLGWRPKMADMEQILESAWTWHKNHPEGFEK